ACAVAARSRPSEGLGQARAWERLIAWRPRVADASWPIHAPFCTCGVVRLRAYPVHARVPARPRPGAFTLADRRPADRRRIPPGPEDHALAPVASCAKARRQPVDAGPACGPRRLSAGSVAFRCDLAGPSVPARAQPPVHGPWRLTHPRLACHPGRGA